MHEILILFVIAIIVGFQIKIFLDAVSKIDFFKVIISNDSDFEIVKVFIAESEVKDIKIEYILNNLDKFQNPLEIVDSLKIKGIDNTVETAINLIDDYPEEVSESLVEEIVDYESLIWISKGSEEKKIKLKLLKSHEISGWNRIQ